MSSGHLLSVITDQFRIAFEMNCLTLLVAGYKKLLHTKTVDLSWEEEKITMELARCMRLCNEERSWRIHIVPEPRLYADEFYASGSLPKEAPKIDLQLLNWSSPYELIYNIEAKNLAESDWMKSAGTKVSSSDLTARYIDTGIENFINDRYTYGCLTGYVLNGRVQNVVAHLNDLLKKRKRMLEDLTLTAPIENYSFCYQSLHQKNKGGHNFIIPHIILRFS